MQHRAAKTTVEFYETTREYHLAVESFLNEAKSTSRNQANAASLQEQMQDENKGPGPSQSSQWNGQSKEARFKDRKCVCGKIHLFRLCPIYRQISSPPCMEER